MIPVDIHVRTPLYQQVMEQILDGVAQGVYPPGEALPSLRQAAVETGLNINTVKRAFRELEQQGVIMSFPGRGSVVCTGGAAQDALQREAAGQAEQAIQNARLRKVPRAQIDAIIDKIYGETCEG